MRLQLGPQSPDTEEPIATGGKLGCFRSPEPKMGKSAPALFGISNPLSPPFDLAASLATKSSAE